MRAAAARWRSLWFADGLPMNAGPSPVDLAREPDFQLGALIVRPSRREIAAGETRSFLEPRVMQALVALVRREGEVVSRDELISACWGRIVGDDAINACVAKVRRAGEATAAFAIETIPRVGYRLQSVDKRPAAPAAGAGIVLAVLPFENLSDDGGLGYFSDGVSEEILNTLARRTDIRVIGRSSSFQIRDKTIANVVRQLGASHVLDGAVQRSGDKVRISAQLIDCSTQTALWADRFERTPSDIFDLQDEVAGQVASAMQCALRLGAPAVRADPQTYDLYLRGSVPPTQTTRASLLAKIAVLQEATTLAPAFADAWARLAFARASLAPMLVGAEAEAVREEARRDASRALSLAPRCAVAAIALARAEATYGRFQEQRYWLGQALSWTPNDSFVLWRHALFAASVGRLRRSVEQLRLAVRFDPLDYGVSHGLSVALLLNGELEAADTTAIETLRRWPEFTNTAAAAAQIAAFRGDFARARALHAAHDCGLYHGATGWFIDVYADGSPASRGRVLSLLQDQARASRASPDTVAFVAHLGFADEAIELALASGIERPSRGDPRESETYFLPTLFAVGMPELRRDPRFAIICDRLGLVDFWFATDEWPDCVEEVAPYYDFKAECRRALEARRS